MVVAGVKGKQQEEMPDTDLAKRKSKTDIPENQDQDPQNSSTEVDSRLSHGREDSRSSSRAESAGVRSGGEGGWGPNAAVGATDEDDRLEEEAAVGSIHHILKTAFKELYGGGGDKEEEDTTALAEVEEKPGSASSSGSRRKSGTAIDGECGEHTGFLESAYICYSYWSNFPTEATPYR